MAQLSAFESQSQSLCRVPSTLPPSHPSVLSWAAHWRCRESFENTPPARALPRNSGVPDRGCGVDLLLVHMCSRMGLCSGTADSRSGMSLIVCQLKMCVSYPIPFIKMFFCLRGRRKASFCTWGAYGSEGLAPRQPSLHTCCRLCP